MTEFDFTMTASASSTSTSTSSASASAVLCSRDLLRRVAAFLPGLPLACAPRIRSHRQQIPTIGAVRPEYEYPYEPDQRLWKHECVALADPHGWLQFVAAWLGDLPLLQAMHAAAAALPAQSELRAQYELTPSVVNLAAARGHLHVLQWLHASTGVEFMADASWIALEHGQVAVGRWLVDTFGPERMQFFTATGYSALYTACSHGQLEALQYLAARGLVLEPDGTVAAAKNGHLHVLRWLMEDRGVACVEDTLYAAADHDHGHILRYLWDLQRHTWPCIERWVSPYYFFSAQQNNRWNTVESLVAMGVLDQCEWHVCSDRLWSRHDRSPSPDVERVFRLVLPFCSPGAVLREVVRAGEYRHLDLAEFVLQHAPVRPPTAEMYLAQRRLQLSHTSVMDSRLTANAFDDEIQRHLPLGSPIALRTLLLQEVFYKSVGRIAMVLEFVTTQMDTLGDAYACPFDVAFLQECLDLRGVMPAVENEHEDVRERLPHEARELLLRMQERLQAAQQ